MNREEQRADLVARDKRSVWHPYTPMLQYRESGRPLVIDSASGSRLFDLDGRSIIDGNASWWTSLLGHNHPRLVERLRVQSQKLCHASLAGITHQPAVEFAEALLRVSPPGMTQAFFSDNGSTAVEAALKLSLQYWTQTTNTRKKRRFLSLEHAFHGETMGATALCGVEAFVAPFDAVGLSVSRLPSPAEDLSAAIDALDEELASRGDEIAALVVEPLIQGAGGMLIYDPAYLREARRLCSQHNVLLVVDEVFTGYGRTGTFWACDHAQISPDILCTAKGLSGGILPFAATLVSEKVFEAFLGTPDRAFYYGHTYCGNPLGASVAAEVLSIYEDENIVAGTAERSTLISQAFQRLSGLSGVENARSLGMCGAVNLRGGKGYLERGGWRVFEKALDGGVYVRPLGNVVYVTPPLNIPISDLSELLFVVEKSVGEVALEAQTW